MRLVRRVDNARNRAVPSASASGVAGVRRRPEGQEGDFYEICERTLGAGAQEDAVELQGNFRATDGRFAADQTSFWGAKIGGRGHATPFW